MKFDLKKPCKNCPWRSDNPAPIQATQKQMTVALENPDYSQGCHKNLGKRYQEDQFCAGAILSKLKRGISNKVLDRAIKKGEFSPEKMDKSVEVI